MNKPTDGTDQPTNGRVARLVEALRAVRRMRSTPIVDDDFPEMRDRADGAVHLALSDIADKGEPFDFETHLARQADWSGKTFGPGARTEGVIDHIRSELDEIAAAPTDLSEWIDVAILALDGAWRSGATPQQIIAALQAKQLKNESRVWPDWRTVEPGKRIEHDRTVSA